MGRKYTDNALTTLLNSIGAGATTLAVAAGKGDNFPAITGAGTPGSTPNYFVVTLENASGNIEKIRVEHRASGSDTLGSASFPLVRGYDGTVARAWTAGDSVDLRLEREGVQGLEDAMAGAGAAKLLGYKDSTTSALNLGYYGGILPSTAGPITISDGVIALSNNATNYVECSTGGVVSKNTAGFTAGSIPMLQVVTASSKISSITDKRGALWGADADAVRAMIGAVGLTGGESISGNKTFNNGVRLASVISPAQLTTDENDYNPTGLSSNNTIRLSADAARTITGLTATVEGDIKILHVTGSYPITLAHASASSAAANRFQFDDDITVWPGASIALRYDGTSARWRSVGRGTGKERLSNISERAFGGAGMVGGRLEASVAANVLTVALKTDENALDPSKSEPVFFRFRSSSLSAGNVARIRQEAAASIVINNTAEMGALAGTPFRLWVVAFNDAGTLRLGLINCLLVTAIGVAGPDADIYPLGAWGIADSTLEGNGSDAAHVFYTDGAAVTNKAYCVLGYLEWTSGLATPGVWDTAPDRVVLYNDQVPLPGRTVQTVSEKDGDVATGTTTIPLDNTNPQNTEGTQFISKAIVSRSPCNVFEIEHVGMYSLNIIGHVSVALFQDATVGSLAATAQAVSVGGAIVSVALRHQMQSGIAEGTSTTFKARAGGDAASTVTFNGSGGARIFSGRAQSRLTVRELMA